MSSQVRHWNSGGGGVRTAGGGGAATGATGGTAVDCASGFGAAGFGAAGGGRNAGSGATLRIVCCWPFGQGMSFCSVIAPEAGSTQR